MKKFLATCIPVLFLLPVVSHGYFTTNQSAIDLGDRTGLFLIEYKFGVEDFDLHMPLIAKHEGGVATNFLSYEILDNQDNPVEGTSFGIVLGNAKIDTNGMYRIPAGFGDTFLLAVFYTPPPEEGSEKYRLRVNHLPFTFVDHLNLQLNPSELQYYITPPLSLQYFLESMVGSHNYGFSNANQ